jgi:hypothetical protein
MPARYRTIDRRSHETSSSRFHGDFLIYTGDPVRERGLIDFVVRFTLPPRDVGPLRRPGFPAESAAKRLGCGR